MQKTAERKRSWLPSFYSATYDFLSCLRSPNVVKASPKTDCFRYFARQRPVEKLHFMGFYDATDLKMIEKAFGARNDLQYYTDRPVDDRTISAIKAHCKDFFIKTKDVHSRIQEKQVASIRKAMGTEIEAES